MTEHKFFSGDLDINLDSMLDDMRMVELEIMSGKAPQITPELLESMHGSLSTTSLSRYYNVFAMPTLSFYKLYLGLRDKMREVSDHYGLDFEKQRFYISGWINMDTKDDPNFLEGAFFHEHYGGTGAPDFHGYFSVNAEPSRTLYKVDAGEEVTYIENKNNRFLISETGHPHTRGFWEQDFTRATLAYDIIPLQRLEERRNGLGTQTWIPL